MIKNQSQFLKQQARQALEKLKKLHHDPSWVSFGQNPCRKFKMHIGNRLLSKGQIIIDLPMKTLANKLANEETLKQLNSQLIQIKTLIKLDDEGRDVRVNYMRFKGIWPVQDRDFVNVSVKDEDESSCCIASMSSKYVYPLANKVTRATCHIAGYILSKIDEKSTLMVYISDVDVAGSIPQMFKNLLAEREASIPLFFRNLMANLYNKKEEQLPSDLDAENNKNKKQLSV